jgi:hypothetical protein
LLVAERVAQAIAGPVTSVAAAQRVATYLAPVEVMAAVEDKYVIF